ncbi:MAG: hypothetical protein Unbinned706contig1000_24 [Prokaryotic dsDNA virus sp.]|nr:MAG: hypothetical protein Unbinned706contig1000_24 [Prokaryotic dsDNA virus sp.]|tara:strand:+ start:22577 stop:23062 length:486 start_codon:yes stop_codon:yes gene_type:complete
MNQYIEDNNFSLMPSYVESINNNRSVIQDAAELLKGKIESGELIEQDCPVTHRFSPGLYLREILMPKGTRIIGKIHATEHFNVVLTGSCTVITAEGKEEIKAPYTFISKAGVQKVVVVHEDCRWQTLHVTDKTDVDEIEKEVIVEDYDHLLVDGLLNKIKG